MKKFIIAGAGCCGEKMLDLLGEENVSYFMDNSVQKQGKGIGSKRIYSFEEGLSKRVDEEILIALSGPMYEQVKDQLEDNNIFSYVPWQKEQYKIVKAMIQTRPNYIEVYQKAIQWIKENTVPEKGIILSTMKRKPYPEVTGYYIPSLLRWGYKDLAISYAQWLCSIQKSDGAWFDVDDIEAYIFDSAQILKGLCAVYEYYPNKKELECATIKGCEWVLSNMTAKGNLKSNVKDAWGDGKTISELIHTYCLSPLVSAAKLYNRPDFEDKAKQILKYYAENQREDIVNFGLLSHFYAYVVEGMLDMGEVELAKEAMHNIEKLQKESGAVPAYKNVDWVCSPGLFQLSVVWYRLGNLKRGNKAFEYACKLQNVTGGWYGSYLSEENPNETNSYFPDAELSWPVKYFLDALYYRNLAQFEMQASTFEAEIAEDDGRYQVVRNVIGKENAGSQCNILDVGCGKGRYLRRLFAEMPTNHYCAVDLSMKVMEYFSDLSSIEKKQGSLTNIPYDNELFDVTYTCEALEHAIDVEKAIAELARVTKENGKIVIIDKNKAKYGHFEIEAYEQWFDEEELKGIMLNYCSSVEVIKEIDYEGQKADGLFYAWIGIKK